MKKETLIITNHYLDRLGGGTFASRAFISAFEEVLGNCTLIYPSNGGDISKKLHPNVALIPCDDKRTRLKKGIDVYLGKLHRFSAIASDYIKKNQPRYVIFDHSKVSGAILDVALKNNCKIITLHHNVESDYLADNKVSWLFRIPFDYYSKRSEKNTLLKSNLNITLTAHDSLILKKLYAPHKDIKISPCGIFEPMGLNNKMPTKKTDNEKVTFVITGRLSFPQSEHSILEFLDHYYPILASKIFNNKLIISGRNPSDFLRKKCASFDQVELIPNPEEMSKVIQQADYYICPVDLGSGVKLRIMDGLQLGLPIIAHKLAARGYEMFENTSFFHTYEKMEDFGKLVELIKNTPLPESKLIFKKYKESFSFDAGCLRLKDIFRSQNIIKI